jgi:acyl-coenzyme A thioesterase PaaI-like protein
MLNPQPNADSCFICGRLNPHGLHMNFFDNGVDEVYADYTVPVAYEGYPGLVHGGIVAAMLDEVVGRVAMIDDHHHFMMTVRLELKYRRPVPVETPLHLVGRVERLRGRLGKAVGELFLPDGILAVEASLTLADLPPDFLAGADPAAFGWRVDR